MDPATPAAAVRWGTTPKQKTVLASLGTLAERVRSARLRPPAVVVIGEVVEMARVIGWYEALPLFGKKVVVTRAARQAAELTDRLFEHGADVVEFPVIEIVDADDGGAEPAALSRLSEYDWLVLTSVNGVERFFDKLAEHGRDIRELAGVRLAAIGPATRAAIEVRGLKVAAQPNEYRAEALLDALGEVGGQRILLARAAEARDVLPRELTSRGATVDVAPLYKTALPQVRPDVGVLEGAEVVTFTSASTVRNFIEIAGDRGREALAQAVVAAIGPITADALQAVGVNPQVIPEEYTIPGLVEALVTYIARRPSVE